MPGLRHLVQEEHPAARKADTCPTAGVGLARPRPLSAAHQTRVPNRVMQRAERAVADQPDNFARHAARCPLYAGMAMYSAKERD